MEYTEHLEGLNPAQKDAVTTTEGPLLVLAGAGSGKTRVITHRIIHLITQGIQPQNILAVTFTNKAAKEMRERVHLLLKKFPNTERTYSDGTPTVTTFHALGVKILRERHEAIGLHRHFTIYDRSDSVRAIKRALEKAGYDAKQFEPRKMLSIISRAKGDALSRGEFMEQSRSYPERVAGEVWEHYEAILKSEQALDFDDLLLKTLNLLKTNLSILEEYRARFRYIHVDEYQDTNRVQYEIVRLITGNASNVCVVGDIDQCLVPETEITMADGRKKSIAQVSKGDMVLSNYGSGDYRPSMITNVYTKKPKEMLVQIVTAKGRTLTSTKNHIHFAGYVLGITPQTYFTYLMWKQEIGWRIGTSQVYTNGQKKPVVGFIQRCNQEHADAIWILDTHTSIQEARIQEYTLSLMYQIPTIPFVARKGLSTQGYVHDQAAISKIFSSFETEVSAQKILNDFGLSFSHPHHRPQASRSDRKNIVVSLCGDRRGKTPMHRISVVGSDLSTKKILEAQGFSVRSAKKGSLSWRFETALSSFEAIQQTVLVLQKLMPEAQIIQHARLGKQHGETINKNSLLFLPASSLRIGMALFDEHGDYDTIAEIHEVAKTQTVYDIDVAHTHNFIANGIMTHNSIYSWRGADIKNILQFERHFPQAKIIMLEENYRSTQTIIAASNAVIEKNVNRPAKTVFTKNQEGEPISLYAAMGENEEAEHVALTAKRLIQDGASPSGIAILFRTNFQSRALEEAFINFGVPYQVLGTRFFERREIKDILSYLRLALNPDSQGDLARIINEPTRGIGKVTLLKVLEGKHGELTGATRAKVDSFFTMMMEIGEYARQNPVHETLKFIMKRTTMEEEMRGDGEEGLERLENLRELVSLATRYGAYDPSEAVEHLLEDAALQSDQDELKEKEEQDAVRLMTVHAAKGLEFSYVFITGLEEGLFPHERLSNEKIDEEEERRLFYVALTRAQKKVFLTFAHIRTIFGSQRVNVPSSFLGDIGDDLIENQNPQESGYERTIFLD